MPLDPSTLSAPIPELLQRIKTDPQNIFQKRPAADIILARAPGRLDIIGGLSDFAGALACDMTLDVGTAVAFQKRDDRKLVIKNFASPPSIGLSEPAAPTKEIFELSLDDFYGTSALLPNGTVRDFFQGQSHWAASVAGAYPTLAKHRKITRRAPGANIAVYSTIPGGAGLASASATACAALAAMTSAYHLILDPLEVALIAMKIEHHVVGSSTGISAAAASVLAKKNEIHLLHCQPHESRGNVPVPEGFTFLGICTGATSVAAVTASRRARTEAFMAQAIIARMYQDLGFRKDPTNGFLANVSPELYPSYFRSVLPEEITVAEFRASFGELYDRTSIMDPAVTYCPRRSAEYHVFEAARSREFVDRIRAIEHTHDNAVRDVQAAAIGKLIIDSHNAAIQAGGPRSDRTDLLFDLLTADGPSEGIHGARAVGGTLTVFAENTPDARSALAQVCDQYQRKTGARARILDQFSSGSSANEPVKISLSDL